MYKGVAMELLKVKKITSLEKVFPDQEPSGEGMEDVITALKKETVSFQMAYYWGGERKGRAQVQVTADDKEQVRVRSVRLVPCEYPAHMVADEDYLTTKPGLYPDLLSEIQPWGVELISGQWKSLWIDVDTTGLAAGDHTIKSGYGSGRRSPGQFDRVDSCSRCRTSGAGSTTHRVVSFGLSGKLLRRGSVQ